MNVYKLIIMESNWKYEVSFLVLVFKFFIAEKF